MPIPSRGIGVGQWLVRESVAVKGQRAEANPGLDYLVLKDAIE